MVSETAEKGPREQLIEFAKRHPEQYFVTKTYCVAAWDAPHHFLCQSQLPFNTSKEKA